MDGEEDEAPAAANLAQETRLNPDTSNLHHYFVS
jgi:hypothetical protein